MMAGSLKECLHKCLQVPGRDSASFSHPLLEFHLPVEIMWLTRASSNAHALDIRQAVAAQEKPGDIGVRYLAGLLLIASNVLCAKLFSL